MNKRFLLLLSLLALLLTTLLLASCAGLIPTSSTANGDGTAASTPADSFADEPKDSSQGTVASSSTPTVTTPPRPTVGNPSVIGYKSDKASKLPTISIKTEGGAEIVSREEYLKATVSITDTLDDEIFGLTDRETEIRCRGNFTYTGDTMDKKSYRLKFTEKINLFGQGSGEAKSWVLLANHCDKTLLRNHLAFTVGRLLDNIDYCSSSSFVQLYINGEYAGVYQVAEQHNVNKYRVNIQEDPNVIDTDYLIERDEYAKDDGPEGITYFTVSRADYNIKTDYPDSPLAADKCEFLRDYFQKTHDAIKGGKKTEVLRYIDIDSFIDTFILQATVKNIDIGWSSFFMVKKAGGKIYFTCPWDFDLALGNDDRLDHGQVETLYVGEKTDLTQQHEWFYLLMNEEWFCDMLLKRWNEVKDEISEAMLYEIDRYLVAFNDDMNENFALWNVFGKKINQEPLPLLRLKTYRANVLNMREWVVARITYLDTLFNSEDLYNQGGEESSNWWDDNWWGGW